MASALSLGARGIRRRPLASLVSGLCLALGIGASATAVALHDATVRNPFGLSTAADLLVLWESDPAHPRDLIEVSLLNFEDWERQSASFASMAAFGSSHWPGIGRAAGESFSIAPRGVSKHFFRTLGRVPALGRDFSDVDLELSSPRPMVLSHAFWVARFGGSADVIGSSLFLDNVEHRVIGVMPQGFAFPDSPDVWISVERVLRDALATTPLPAQRMVGLLEVVGRLKPGVGEEAALRELNLIASALQQQHYPPDTRSIVVSTAFTDVVLGRLGARLWIALGMTAAVLLFACANVAALRLAHLRERAGELTARLSLGASKPALLRQLFAETVPLVVLASLGGVAISAALGVWLNQVPIVATSGIDLSGARAVLFVALGAATLISWGLVSAGPALVVVSRTTPTTVPSATRTVVRGSRSTSALLLAQSALAICLVAMAGGAFRMFAALARTDVGFSTTGVTALDISVPDWKYASPDDRRLLDERLLAGLKTVAGATAVAGVSVRPFRFGEIADGIPVRRPEDVTTDKNAAVGGNRVIVTPDYFTAMGIAIEEGRELTEFDRTAAKPVAVISRGLARTLWAEGSAVGREIEYATVRGWQRYLVVGIAEDVRSRVIDRPALEVYVAHGRGGLPLGSYVIKHAAAITLTDAVIRAALRNVDPDLVVDRVQTTRSVIDAVIAPSRLLTTAMTVLGTTGVILLALGIFGAAATTLRVARGEMAIRQAVGATPLTAARAPLRSLLTALAIGIAAGVLMAPGALGVLVSMGVAQTAGVSVTLAMAGAAVIAASACAIGLTLRSAVKVSPAELLRAE